MKLFAFLLLVTSPALAQDAGGTPSPFAGILPIVLIIGIFYFLIIRPQNKKYKEHRAMIDAIERGDHVVTGGGIHGKVTRVEEGGQLKVEISSGVEVIVEQSTVSQVKSKPEPAKNAEKKTEESGETKPAKKKAKSPKAANDNG